MTRLGCAAARWHKANRRAEALVRRRIAATTVPVIVALAAVVSAIPAQATGPAVGVGVPSAPRSVARPVLSLGVTSPYVVYVQHKLGIRPESGYFGAKTREVVMTYQASHGLPATGIVAELTWARLTGESQIATVQPAAATAGKATKVLSVAASLAGVPYAAKGTNPQEGFNCSSYTQWVFDRAGVDVGGAFTVWQFERARKISAAEARPGDLVFFYNYPKKFLGHVGIYAGNGMIWHSPRTGRVVSLDPIYTDKVLYGRVL